MKGLLTLDSREETYLGYYIGALECSLRVQPYLKISRNDDNFVRFDLVMQNEDASAKGVRGVQLGDSKDKI